MLNDPLRKSAIRFLRLYLEQFLRLPEWARVTISVVGILTAIVVSIFAVVFRTELMQFTIIVLGTVLGATLLFGLGWFALSIVKKSERDRNEAAHAAAEGIARRAAERAKLMASIQSGEIRPWPDTAGVFLRNSETLWHKTHAFVPDRNGQHQDGALCITSLRVLFLSPACPIEIPISVVNAVKLTEASVTLIARTSAGTQTFSVDDPDLVAAYVERAVKAFHRQVDVGFEEQGRHIPQDVKTTVWQRDGGKCVQCGAADYLEYDHIIPYSRGGANSVGNVQLLCRRCNLKKSSNI